MTRVVVALFIALSACAPPPPGYYNPDEAAAGVALMGLGLGIAGGGGYYRPAAGSSVGCHWMGPSWVCNSW